MTINEEARRLFLSLQDAGYHKDWLVDISIEEDSDGLYIEVVSRHLGKSQQVLGSTTPHGYRVKHLHQPS